MTASSGRCGEVCVEKIKKLWLQVSLLGILGQGCVTVIRENWDVNIQKAALRLKRWPERRVYMERYKVGRYSIVQTLLLIK